ncbi:MAG: hypothetical protein H0U57_12670 [Tatlockia sp.]|nr:hypothetical protein [Tatlockia sp.]
MNKLTTKKIDKKIATQVSNHSYQQLPNEMQNHYMALQNLQQQKANKALSIIQGYINIVDPQNKELTDEEMDQMRTIFFNSKVCMSVLNFCKEIQLLVTKHKNTIPGDVLMATGKLKESLENALKTGFEDHLNNQTELKLYKKTY